MKTFEDLFSELQHKASTPPRGLRDRGGAGPRGPLHRQETVEEAAEAWMACEHESDEAACEEISQLLYHAQVMMVAKGYSLQDVYRYL